MPFGIHHGIHQFELYHPLLLFVFNQKRNENESLNLIFTQALMRFVRHFNHGIECGVVFGLF